MTRNRWIVLILGALALLVAAATTLTAQPMPPRTHVKIGSTTATPNTIAFGSGFGGSFDGGTAIVYSAGSGSSGGAVTVTQNDGGTTQVAAVYATNNTPATASATVQQPGCIELVGKAWGGDGGSTVTNGALCWVPEAGASKGATSGHWSLRTVTGAGTMTEVARVDGKTGAVNVSGTGGYAASAWRVEGSSYSLAPSVAALNLVHYASGVRGPAVTFWRNGSGHLYMGGEEGYGGVVHLRSAVDAPSGFVGIDLAHGASATITANGATLELTSSALTSSVVVVSPSSRLTPGGDSTACAAGNEGAERYDRGATLDGGTGLSGGKRCCNKLADDTYAWGACAPSLREIAAAGRSSSYSAVHTVAGAFSFAANDYKLATTAPTVVFRSVSAMATAGVTGYVALYNATDGETVATQTITSTSTVATDSTLTVGLGAGNVKPTAKVYEVHIYTAPVDGGTVSDTIEHYSSVIRLSN